jgi:hypothetical protein
MIENSNLLIPLFLSVILVGLIIFKRGIVDPLGILMCYYLFFSFGPIVNLLLGFNIYFGVKREYLNQASWIFFVAIFSMSVVEEVIS